MPECDPGRGAGRLYRLLLVPRVVVRHAGVGLRYTAGGILVGSVPAVWVVEPRVLVQLVLIEPGGPDHGIRTGTISAYVVRRRDKQGAVQARSRGHGGRGVRGHVPLSRVDLTLHTGVAGAAPGGRGQGGVVLRTVREPERLDVHVERGPVVGGVSVVRVVG